LHCLNTTSCHIKGIDVNQILTVAAQKWITNNYLSNWTVSY
jgi:hypothetical protein